MVARESLGGRSACQQHDPFKHHSFAVMYRSSAVHAVHRRARVQRPQACAGGEGQGGGAPAGGGKGVLATGSSSGLCRLRCQVPVGKGLPCHTCCAAECRRAAGGYAYNARNPCKASGKHRNAGACARKKSGVKWALVTGARTLPERRAVHAYFGVTCRSGRGIRYHTCCAAECAHVL